MPQLLALHYTVAQKAAHDAVRYLSSVPKAEIYSMNSSFVEIDAAVFSKSLAYIEAAEIPGARYIEAQCDGATCLGGSVPSRVRVLVRIQYSDSIFPLFTSAYGGDQTRVITADVSMPYVGR